MDSKLEASLKSMKEDITAFVKSLGAGKPSKKGYDIDAVAYKEFATAIGSKTGKKASFSLELKDVDFTKVKTAGDISLGGNITGELPQAELDTTINDIAQRVPFIEELATVGTISSDLDAWVEVVSLTGVPLPVAEAVKLPQIQKSWKRATAEVKKIGGYAKYTSEMAEDLPNLIADIKNTLIRDTKLTIDNQLINGDGEYDDLIGVLKNAVTYNAGSFAGTIDKANRFDVIETAVNQVIVAHHMPNVVCLNPVDVSKMNLTKDANGQYILPPFITADKQIVSGVRIVANTGITAGTFLVGDFSKLSVKYKKGLTLEMTNTDQDDFVRDMFTVRAIVRLVARVKANDYGAFVKGSFATAISALELAS
jgi:HK97 family phage major capsid protein